jgi:hypothetical protein
MPRRKEKQELKDQVYMKGNNGLLKDIRQKWVL